MSIFILAVSSIILLFNLLDCLTLVDRIDLSGSILKKSLEVEYSETTNIQFYFLPSLHPTLTFQAKEISEGDTDKLSGITDYIAHPDFKLLSFNSLDR